MPPNKDTNRIRQLIREANPDARLLVVYALKGSEPKTFVSDTVSTERVSDTIDPVLDVVCANGNSFDLPDGDEE